MILLLVRCNITYNIGRFRNEGVLVSLSNRLPAETMASLPPAVQRRVRALRNLQREFVDYEAKFYKEVHELECKYEKLYKPLFDKVLFFINKHNNYVPSSTLMFLIVSFIFLY